MSFHGRAPHRIQHAMQAMVPAPRRKMYSADMNPMLGDIQRGYHPTEEFIDNRLVRPQLPMTDVNYGRRPGLTARHRASTGVEDLQSAVREIAMLQKDPTRVGSRHSPHVSPRPAWDRTDAVAVAGRQPQAEVSRDMLLGQLPQQRQSLPSQNSIDIDDPWSGSYFNGYSGQDVNREVSPSTTANTPAYRSLPGAPSQPPSYAANQTIDVSQAPPKGAGFSPKEMADWLIAQQLGTQAAVIGGGIAGIGALGAGVNVLQGDPNGALGLGTVAQAGLLGGAGAGLGHGAMEMYQNQNHLTARGFEQPTASAAPGTRRGRHRAYGAVAGTGAGLISALTMQLNDRLQTEQY